MPFINRCSGGGGTKVFIDGEQSKAKKVSLETYTSWESQPSLVPPVTTFVWVDKDGLLNAMGEISSTSTSNHYKCIDGVWTIVDTAPKSSNYVMGQCDCCVDKNGTFYYMYKDTYVHTATDLTMFGVRIYKYKDGVYSAFTGVVNSDTTATTGIMLYRESDDTLYFDAKKVLHKCTTNGTLTSLGTFKPSMSRNTVFINQNDNIGIAYQTTYYEYNLSTNVMSGVCALPTTYVSNIACIDTDNKLTIFGISVTGTGYSLYNQVYKLIDDDFVLCDPLPFYADGSPFLKYQNKGLFPYVTHRIGVISEKRAFLQIDAYKVKEIN